MKQEQKSFERFIKDAKYKQLESGTAVNDMAAYDAVLNAQKSKASIVMSDKESVLKVVLDVIQAVHTLMMILIK